MRIVAAVLLLIASLFTAQARGQQLTRADVIRFSPLGSDRNCVSSRYELFVSAHKFRVCQDGTLHDVLGSGPLDLSNYVGDVFLASPSGQNFLGTSDELTAISASNGTAFSSIHAWPTGELILAYGDGTLNGGEGASLSGNPATGALVLAAGSFIASGPGIQYTPQASPPFACDAGHEGYEYADTSHAKCFCDGTTWNKLTGSGAGTCS